jgi:hypothetical protein
MIIKLPNKKVVTFEYEQTQIVCVILCFDFGGFNSKLDAMGVTFHLSKRENPKYPKPFFTSQLL